MTCTCLGRRAENLDPPDECALCRAPAPVLGLHPAPGLPAPVTARADAAMRAALTDQPFSRVNKKIVVQTQPFDTAGNVRPIRLLMKPSTHTVGVRKAAPTPLSFLPSADLEKWLQSVAVADDDEPLVVLARATPYPVGALGATGPAPRTGGSGGGDDEAGEGVAKRRRTTLAPRAAEASFSGLADPADDEERKGEPPSSAPEQTESELGDAEEIWAQGSGLESGAVDMDDVDVAQAGSQKTPGAPAGSSASKAVDPVVTLFDRGHVFALELNGDDHPWQIVPQMRSCNRGTWRWMETDVHELISSRNEKTKYRARIACATSTAAPRDAASDAASAHAAADAEIGGSPSVSAAPVPARHAGAKRAKNQHLSLNTAQTLDDKGYFAAQVFVFYPNAVTDAACMAEDSNTARSDAVQEHRDLLQRIPCWFYVQLYFVCDAGHWGVAHYTVANGVRAPEVRATDEEKNEFLRAHAALGYPLTRDTNGQWYPDRQWYPDPTYSALQWLSENNSTVVARQDYKAESFKGGQISIIRKYNAWLNGGSMLSDYRQQVRDIRLNKAQADFEIYQALNSGEQLTPTQEDHREKMAKMIEDDVGRVREKRIELFKANLVANGMPETTTFAGSPVNLARLASGVAAWNWDCYPNMNQAYMEVNSQLQQMGPRDKLRNSYKQWLKMIDQNREQLLQEQSLGTKKAVMMGTPGADRYALSNALLEATDQRDEINSEPADWYYALSLSGGRSYPEVDHIKPQGRGGKNRYDNARLISFAQNHIYRDKHYLSNTMSRAEKDLHLKRCKSKHDAEESKVALDGLLSSHLAAVDAFNGNSQELHDLIESFNRTYDVALRNPSAAELALAEEAAPDEPDQDEGDQVDDKLDADGRFGAMDATASASSAAIADADADVELIEEAWGARLPLHSARDEESKESQE